MSSLNNILYSDHCVYIIIIVYKVTISRLITASLNNNWICNMLTWPILTLCYSYPSYTIILSFDKYSHCLYWCRVDKPSTSCSSEGRDYPSRLSFETKGTETLGLVLVLLQFWLLISLGLGIACISFQKSRAWSRHKIF